MSAATRPYSEKMQKFYTVKTEQKFASYLVLTLDLKGT